MSELSFILLKNNNLKFKMNNLLYLLTPTSTAIAEVQNKINTTEFNIQYALVSYPDAVLKTKSI